MKRDTWGWNPKPLSFGHCSCEQLTISLAVSTVGEDMMGSPHFSGGGGGGGGGNQKKSPGGPGSFPHVHLKDLGLGENETTRGPQVLVHISIYQVSLLDTHF